MKINALSTLYLEKLVIFLLILLVCNQSSYGQELKKVTKTNCSDIEEQYYVLKKDREIKNGPYRLAIKNSICQLGFYLNNNRTGIWNIYDYNHNLEFKYNFDTKRLYDLDKKYFTNPNDSTTRAPVYLGGTAFLLYRATCFIKPGEELYQHISPGKYRVVVKFEIDSTGIAENFGVLTSCGQKTLDDEAVRCVKLASDLSFPFLPALEKGKPSKCNIMLPINFTYSEVNRN